MSENNETEFGPEYLLIFVGYSSDADYLAETVVALEPIFQRELDKLRRVNSTVPFNRVKVWKWDSDAAAIKGGQEAVITPALKRANIATFIFNERIGEVAWRELNYALDKKPPVPVLPFFKSVPPSREQMMKEDVAEQWLDLLKKSKSLTENWTDPETNAVTPLPKYSDKNYLEQLARDRIITEIVRLASVHAIKSNEEKKNNSLQFDYSSIPTNSFILGTKSNGEPFLFKERGHISNVIPNIRNFNGACLILDPTGDIYRGTADHRAKLGAVLKLDPWSLVPDAVNGSLNPIDVLIASGLSPNEAARYLSELFIPFTEHVGHRRELLTSEPYWLNMGRKLMLGLLLLAIKESDNNQAILTRVRNILHEDDIVYNLAVKLDTTGKEMDPELRQELAFFLQQADNSRSSITSMVSQFLMALGNTMAQRLTDTTSISIESWIKGDPISIYLIGPPAGIAAFDSIYRGWLGSLLLPISMQQFSPDKSYLLVFDIDETFEVWNGVSNIITHNRNCQSWVIASDITELENRFKNSFKSMLNSFSIIQACKPNNFISGSDLAEVFGVAVEEIMKIDDSHLFVYGSNMKLEILSKIQ
jgi:type IV secretion system protein VirD4